MTEFAAEFSNCSQNLSDFEFLFFNFLRVFLKCVIPPGSFEGLL